MSQDHRTPSHHEAETSAGASQPASALRPSLDDFATAVPLVPQTLAKYRIIKMIGQGGMGAVYLAEQENPRRTVALKVIKPGHVSSALLRRFELEAQVLGRLQHPGIAQIFEAGTFDMGHGAQPFFAMEYVEGRPLSELVLERGGQVRERLELIASIADAVQHAHQKGVIHRDLKPANILVTEEKSEVSGQKSEHRDRLTSDLRPLTSSVKILDFGVARATDSDIQAATMQTDLGQIIGTLPYMSPEQVMGDPNELDTRADVYALGVIAYELLSGRQPHDLHQKTITNAARIITENDIASLGTLDRTFRGDIETIVSKALEKDRNDRYPSAADLASDIRRYLHDEPITARPPSTLYQFRKFAKRNKAFVIGVAAVFVILLAAVVVSNYALAQAREQRAIAEDQRNAAIKARGTAELESKKTKAVNDFLIKDMLGAANPEVAQGREITVQMVLDEAVKKVGEAFTDQPELEASVRDSIGATYAGLGKNEQALQQLTIAHDLALKTFGPDDDRTLTEIVDLAVLEDHLGRVDQAVKRMNDELPHIERALGPDHRVTLTAKQVLASFYNEQAKYDLAEPLIKSVLESQQRVLGADHPDTQVSISNYAYLLSGIGRSAESEQLYREILESRQRTLGPDHPDTLIAMNNLAVTLHEINRDDEAEKLMRQAYEGSVRVRGAEHQETLGSMGSLASLLLAKNRIDEAVGLMRQAADTQRRVLGPEHPDTIFSDANIASLLNKQGRHAEAVAASLIVLETSRRVNGPQHPQSLKIMNTLAVGYAGSGDLAKAEDTERAVLQGWIETQGADHPDAVKAKRTLDEILSRKGQAP